MTSDKKNEEANKWAGKFKAKVVSSLFILPIVMWLWPWSVPFKFFELWNYRGTVYDWIYSAWPIFVWAMGVNIIYSIRTYNDRQINRDAEDILIGGAIISIRAGIVEEITCRWLFFMWGIVSIKVANFLFFGFLGFGIASWLHLNIFGPVANWTTFSYLQSYIFHSTGWAMGAALLTTNAFFRDGHKYQGMFGYINSWFIGMYLFWIMFTYGLPAAILVHFLYDFLIFMVRYIDAAIERRMGYF